jgi:hypothetical protein
MDKNEESLCKGLVVGGICGAVGVLGSLVSFTIHPPDVDEVRIFREEEQPAVMRLYRSGTEGHFIEDREDHFVPLKDYISDYGSELEEEYRSIADLKNE